MAALSTLELMLHELQHHEKLDHSCDNANMPMLPQRPVSKARIPTKRVRRAILSFHLQEFGDKKEAFVDSKSKRDGFEFIDGGIINLCKNTKKNEGEEKGEKGIVGIQKCFRGYQARFHYHKLKEGMITLQSFIRGEKTRREFRNSIKRLTQTHIDQDFVWKPLRNRETTIIYLQSVIRAWLTRRHLVYIENTTLENTREVNYLHNENIESEEHVSVSESYIYDLEQQVLKTETALRNRIHENAMLELKIQQIDRKWELHSARMNSKEKTWQDEFTSIQMSLASARERMTKEITYFPQNVPRDQENEKMNLTIRQILEVQESDYSFHIENMSNSRKDHQQELRKLKCRFKTWKTEFKARLQDIKRAFDRFDHFRTGRVHKSCFVS